MIYKIDTLEILKDGDFIGFTPLFKVKGEKVKGYLGEDNCPIVFQTKKEARVYCMNQELRFETNGNR